MMNQLFTNADLDRWMETFQENAEAAIVEQLQAAGEVFVKLARESGSYQNQTGNLRSSIGYVIAYNGKALKDNFQTISGAQSGTAEARQLATKVAGQVKGFILVGVAGMTYAAAVEAKGFEVISSSSLQADGWLKQSIQTIFKHAK